MVEPVFLMYLFQSAFLADTIQRIKGGMGVPHLFQEDLVKFYLPMPPITEQSAIASYLDVETAKVDELIGRQEQLRVILLTEKRQAVISHAVTKGLDSAVPMKDGGVEWLGAVPSHWNVSRLGFEAWVRARLGWKGLKADEYIVSDGYAFLSTPNIKGREIDFDNVNFIDRARF